MRKHFTIQVHGKVQGVLFRQSTKQKANSLELSGTVKNMGDGTVQIHAEGEEKSLEKLLEWCRDGSTLSKVEKVEYKTGEIKCYKDFQII